VLRWSDVDLASGRLALPHTKNGNKWCVFLGTTALRAFPSWRKRSTSDLLLGLAPSEIREVLHRLADRAGVHVSPHILRRYFATASLRNGANVIEVQRLLGHSTTAKVSIYARMTGDDLQAARARFSPCDRLGVAFPSGASVRGSLRVQPRLPRLTKRSRR
jgi:site-specific recombinase XerD